MKSKHVWGNWEFSANAWKIFDRADVSVNELAQFRDEMEDEGCAILNDTPEGYFLRRKDKIVWMAGEEY
jgi:hypothetical protein